MPEKMQKEGKESEAESFYYRNKGMDFPRCQGDCVNPICSRKTTGKEREGERNLDSRPIDVSKTIGE